MSNGDPRKQRFHHPAAHEQHTAAHHETTQQHTALTFHSVEDLLRYDAAHTPLPPALPARLQVSVGLEPPRSWWQRLWSRLRPG